MALYDTYGPKASAVRQIKQVAPVTPPNPAVTSRSQPEPKGPEPKAQAFDRNAYQARYMRRARAKGKYKA